MGEISSDVSSDKDFYSFLPKSLKPQKNRIQIRKKRVVVVKKKENVY